jgi:hypothetical protein
MTHTEAKMDHRLFAKEVMTRLRRIKPVTVS